MVLRHMVINGLYIIIIHVNNLVVSYILGLYSYYIFTFLYLLYVFNKFNAPQSVFPGKGGDCQLCCLGHHRCQSLFPRFVWLHLKIFGAPTLYSVALASN